MSSRPETNFAERAEGLHQYFGWVVKELRKDDYRIGLELTQVWRDLIAREASIHDAIPFFVRVNRVYFSQHYLASGWFGFRCSVLSWVDSTWNNAQKGPTAEEIMLLAKAFEEYFEVVKRFPEAVSLCRRWGTLAAGAERKLREEILQEAHRLAVTKIVAGVGLVPLVTRWVHGD